MVTERKKRGRARERNEEETRRRWLVPLRWKGSEVGVAGDGRKKTDSRILWKISLGKTEETTREGECQKRA